MEFRKIREIMAAMERNKTKRLRIREGDFELELERESLQEEEAQISSQEIGDHALHNEIPPSLRHPHESGEKKHFSKPGDQYVVSPMVGTFYLRPAPDEPPFVKVGDRVEKESVICIIEAMKVMNEVKSGVDGVVSEVLLENGHPVEFGTKLFIISKNS